MQTGSDVITKNSNTLLLSELERADAKANTISAYLCHLKRTEQQKKGELILMMVCTSICTYTVCMPLKVKVHCKQTWQILQTIPLNSGK